MSKTPWQYSLQNAITDPRTLWALLGLDPATMPAAYQAAQQFPLRVPQEFIARMKYGEPDDPLLQQVLPVIHETRDKHGYVPDPLQEQAANPARGILHKFKGRILLTLTGLCVVHCRYCFRREFPYHDNMPTHRGFETVINYIQQDPDIFEVIFSGGDPLSLPDHLLSQFITQLAAIPHLRLLRIHTRWPVMIPSRITDTLLSAITQTRLKSTMVIHCNHPQEIDNNVRAALRLCQQAHIPLLNQSVLLKRINDDVSILKMLSLTLWEAGVLPYYLHLPDKVKGTHHFDVALRKAKQLMRALSTELPGYLVPRLVREVPGAPAKELISLG